VVAGDGCCFNADIGKTMPKQPTTLMNTIKRLVMEPAEGRSDLDGLKRETGIGEG
jgi:hypothetical protein